MCSRFCVEDNRFFFFSSRRRHTRFDCDWSSDVCSSDLRNDFEFQLRELKVHGDDPNEMMMVMLAVHAAEIGDGNAAGAWIARNLVGFLKPPFNVRSETAANNAGYILSTSAGFVQSVAYA